jgi:hypothetical protein
MNHCGKVKRLQGGNKAELAILKLKAVTNLFICVNQ